MMADQIKTKTQGAVGSQATEAAANAAPVSNGGNAPSNKFKIRKVNGKAVPVFEGSANYNAPASAGEAPTAAPKNLDVANLVDVQRYNESKATSGPKQYTPYIPAAKAMPSAPVEAPSAPVEAPVAPSAPVEAPSAPVEAPVAPSAPVQAPVAPVESNNVEYSDFADEETYTPSVADSAYDNSVEAGIAAAALVADSKADKRDRKNRKDAAAIAKADAHASKENARRARASALATDGKRDAQDRKAAKKAKRMEKADAVVVETMNTYSDVEVYEPTEEAPVAKAPKVKAPAKGTSTEAYDGHLNNKERKADKKSTRSAKRKEKVAFAGAYAAGSSAKAKNPTPTPAPSTTYADGSFGEGYTVVPDPKATASKITMAARSVIAGALAIGAADKVGDVVAESEHTYADGPYAEGYDASYFENAKAVAAKATAALQEDSARVREAVKRDVLEQRNIKNQKKYEASTIKENLAEASKSELLTHAKADKKERKTFKANKKANAKAAKVAAGAVVAPVAVYHDHTELFDKTAYDMDKQAEAKAVADAKAAAMAAKADAKATKAAKVEAKRTAAYESYNAEHTEKAEKKEELLAMNKQRKSDDKAIRANEKKAKEDAKRAAKKEVVEIPVYEDFTELFDKEAYEAEKQAIAAAEAKAKADAIAIKKKAKAAKAQAKAEADVIKADEKAAKAQAKANIITIKTNAEAEIAQAKIDAIAKKADARAAKAQAKVDTFAMKADAKIAREVAETKADAEAAAARIDARTAKSEARAEAIKTKRDARSAREVAEAKARAEALATRAGAKAAETEARADAIVTKKDAKAAREAAEAKAKAYAVAIKADAKAAREAAEAKAKAVVVANKTSEKTARTQAKAEARAVVIAAKADEKVAKINAAETKRAAAYEKHNDIRAEKTDKKNEMLAVNKQAEVDKKLRKVGVKEAKRIEKIAAKSAAAVVATPVYPDFTETFDKSIYEADKQVVATAEAEAKAAVAKADAKFAKKSGIEAKNAAIYEKHTVNRAEKSEKKEDMLAANKQRISDNKARKAGVKEENDTLKLATAAVVVTAPEFVDFTDPFSKAEYDAAEKAIADSEAKAKADAVIAAIESKRQKVAEKNDKDIKSTEKLDEKLTKGEMIGFAKEYKSDVKKNRLQLKRSEKNGKFMLEYGSTYDPEWDGEFNNYGLPETDPLTEGVKLAHSRVRTPKKEKLSGFNLSKLNSLSRMQRDTDNKMVAARVHAKFADLELELAQAEQDFSGEFKTGKEKRKIRDSKKELKSLQAKVAMAEKYERLDNERYYSVVATNFDTVDLPRKADRDTLRALREELMRLLDVRDELNAQLLLLYTGSEKGNGINHIKRRNKVVLKARKRAYVKYSKYCNALNKRRATYNERMRIFDKLDEIVELTGEIARIKYILRKEKPIGKGRREYVREKRNAKSNLRYAKRYVERATAKAIRKAKKRQRRQRAMITTLVILALLAGLVGVGYFMGPQILEAIRPMVPADFHQYIDNILGMWPR